MKNKILTTIAVAVCLAAGVAQPLRAQDPSRIERSERRRAAMLGLAPSPAETPVGGQYSPHTLEDLRAELQILEGVRSEEHTSELQSPCNLVCRLLLEKKKKHTASVPIPHKAGMRSNGEPA